MQQNTSQVVDNNAKDKRREEYAGVDGTLERVGWMRKGEFRGKFRMILGGKPKPKSNHEARSVMHKGLNIGSRLKRDGKSITGTPR